MNVIMYKYYWKTVNVKLVKFIHENKMKKHVLQMNVKIMRFFFQMEHVNHVQHLLSNKINIYALNAMTDKFSSKTDPASIALYIQNPHRTSNHVNLMHVMKGRNF